MIPVPSGEIGEAVGLPRPTVHRLVGSLIDTGLLAPRGRGRKAYVAGPRLRRLLHGDVRRERIERLVGPALRKLVERFQETSYLARFDGTRVRSVAMAVPERDWHGHVHPGNEMPIHASASGKAIFAFQPHPIVERAPRQPMAKFTRFTKTNPAAVRRELRQVRNQGYAICREEIDLGLVAYACPVELPDDRRDLQPRRGRADRPNGRKVRRRDHRRLADGGRSDCRSVRVGLQSSIAR